MAYGLKYRSEFVNAQGHSCRLDLFYKDYSGATIALNSGLRAFVLKEFNSDNDFYKPIRPQQAEFEILADVVTLESFLFNDDDSVQVQFSWQGSLYWRGWLIQDDFEESWVDSAHFITLRATEQLSGLNIIAPSLPNGHSTPLDFILNAISTTTISNSVNYGIRILNNLFYETMDDKDVDDTATCLDQMYIANSTFQKTLTTFDDYQTILEKLNTSFNQTIFQYQGAAYLMRMSEFLTYPNNLPGIEFQPFNVVAPRIETNEDYKAYIGIDEEIKPIMPEMLRQVERPFKQFQIDFRYDNPIETICNESQQRGDLVSEDAFLRTYEIDCWNLYTWITRATAAGSNFYRLQDLNNGQIVDDYSKIYTNAENENYLTSREIILSQNNIIQINFSYKRFATGTGSATFNAAYVTFETYGGSKYTLDDDGTWNLSNSSYGTNRKAIKADYSSTQNVNEWVNLEVISKDTPAAGLLYINFINSVAGEQTGVKNIKIKITTGLRTDVIGDYDRYTKSENIKQNLRQQIFLDDGENLYWKGVIFSPDNTLTGDNWYRMQYQSESFTFKRQKAIAHWLLNRRYRQLITGNFYGITWSSYERPIGLMSRFIFYDDAPTKQFMIVNLQEIDFVSCQWKATLIETYDSTLDATLTDYPPHSFDFLYQE
jgi:hypothetical protein